MSLNVGGLYIQIKPGIIQQSIVEAITEYWTSKGAKLDKKLDARSLQPLELENTGQLGFLITDEKQGYIGIYDSERYHADELLAAYLSEKLDTGVYLYGMYGATDEATLEDYGKVPKKTVRGWNKIEKFVAENFPYPFLYYDDLQADQKEHAFEFLAFSKIPYFEDEEYSGPSDEDDSDADEESKKKLAAETELRQCVKNRDAKKTADLLKKNVDLRSEASQILSSLSISDERNLEIALLLGRFVLPTGVHLHTIAEVALRQHDSALFEQAVSAMEANHWAEMLGAKGYYLIQEGKLDEGYLALKAAALHPGAMQYTEIFTNLLYAILKLGVEKSPPAEELDELLQLAESVGPRNPAIYINAALIYVLRKNNAHALDMLEAAARFSFEDLEKFRLEPEFKVLQNHPRWNAIFVEKSVTPARLSELTLHVDFLGKKYCIVRPGLSVCFYLKGSLKEIGPAVGDTIEYYMSRIPSDALCTYYPNRLPCVQGILAKPLPKAQLTRKLSAVRKGTDKESGISLWFTDGKDENVSHHAVCFEGNNPADEEDDVGSCLRFEFPCQDPPSQKELLEFREFCVKIADILPFHSGNAGLGFQYIDRCVSGYVGGDVEATKLCNRFFGFDRFDYNLYWLSGKTASVSWLTFLNQKMMKQVGGLDQIKTSLLVSQIEKMKHGICIQAAAYPPMAPARNPTDLGGLPEVARLLKPTRVVDESPEGEWLCRFDELSNGDFNNAPFG